MGSILYVTAPWRTGAEDAYCRRWEVDEEQKEYWVWGAHLFGAQIEGNEALGLEDLWDVP